MLTGVSCRHQASRELLTAPLAEALRAPEPDWSAPRPVEVAYGGGFGTPRVVLFSGLDTGERSAVVSALEARGLPRLAVASATPANVRSRLGDVLSHAVTEDRKYVRARERAMRALMPPHAARGLTPAAAAHCIRRRASRR